MKKILIVLCGILLLGGCGFYTKGASSKASAVPNDTQVNEPSEATKPAEPANNEPTTTTSNSTLKVGTYIDKTRMYAGASLDTFTLYSNHTIERLYCTTSSDCTNYKGTYSISGDYLYIQLTQYQTYSGSWEEVKRDSDAPMEFAILSQTSFKDAKTTYYLDN